MRLTTEQIKLMGVFQGITGVMARDCIIDDNKTIFVVDNRLVGVAVGKGGKNIKKLESLLGKKVEVIGYSDDLTKFVKNLFYPALILAVNVQEKNGKKYVHVHMDKESRRMVESRMVSKLKTAKTLLKRYYNVDGVVVV